MGYALLLDRSVERGKWKSDFSRASEINYTHAVYSPFDDAGAVTNTLMKEVNFNGKEFLGYVSDLPKEFSCAVRAQSPRAVYIGDFEVEATPPPESIANVAEIATIAPPEPAAQPLPERHLEAA